MSFSLEGKVALVTGGSRGIGRATAIGFAQAGASVVVASRKLPDLEEVAGEIRKTGGKCLPVAAHLGRMEEIATLVKTVKDRFGRIDVLVNNAGTSPTIVSTLDAEERLWNSVMSLNLKGLYFLSQAAARMMKEQGGGRIINVTSVDGIRPEPKLGVYAISKAGVIMVTRVLAVELAEYNIRVNAIAPGNIHTRLGDSRFSAIPGYEEELIRHTPMRRIGDPEELVGAMVFLASDASSFVTGQTIAVDGGFLLG